MDKYCALLVAPDGDYVTDYYASTKDEVIRKLADRGSAWFFYPFGFVVTPRLGKIIDVPDGFEIFKGRSVKKTLEAFKKVFKRVEGLKTEIGIDEYAVLVNAEALGGE